jgi:5-methylcytosine-specific restriction endonuclease McrA
MTIDTGLRDRVRGRANFACEFCEVTETDTGGDLTLDHFHPQAKGATDNFDNLLYCCTRCNQYKLDYWPTQVVEVRLCSIVV